MKINTGGIMVKAGSSTNSSLNCVWIYAADIETDNIFKTKILAG